MTKVFYISHPYTGNEEYNVKESEVFTTILAKKYPSVLFINPLVAMGHTKNAQLQYDVILGQCIKLLSFCDGIIMTGDWDGSNGCKEEYMYAHTHNMKIWDGVDDFMSNNLVGD